MYAFADSAEGDCYLSVPPDPGITAAALGASASAAPGTGASADPSAGASALSGTAPTKALHTFTLDSGASRSFFRDSTTLTPLSRPVAVSLADHSGGPVLAHSSTVLPCRAAPSGLLSGLHLPSFSTNLVSGADLRDTWVDQFAPGGQRVTHCTCSRTGRHLATFTRRPGSSLYTLTTAPPPVSPSGQIAASSQVFATASRSSPASAPCSCRPLSLETLLWHHRLGHPSLPRLRGMASRALVSGLPKSLPPLPPGPAPTCVPCVEGRQHAAPHSSSFPPTEAPLQTLHMDVWGPARIRGQGHERYFLLVVDDYSRYTTVFPLHSKGEVFEVLIDWIHSPRRQLSESFGSDLPVLRLHSDRGGEFSSDLLRAFCHSEGIRQTFTPPRRKMGLLSAALACTLRIRSTFSLVSPCQRPHLLCGGRGRLAMCPHSMSGDLELLSVILQRTSCPPVPFPVSSLASLLTLPGGSSTTPHRVVFCPLKTSRLTNPLPHQGPAPSGVSQVDPAEPVEVAVDSGATRGAEPVGAGTGGAEPGVSVSGGTASGVAELGRVEPEGNASGGAAPSRAESGVPSRREHLTPQQLREWYSRRCRVAAGARGAASAAGGATGAGAAAGGAAGAGGAARATVGAVGATGAGGSGAAGATGGAPGVGGVTGAGAAAGAAGGVGAGAAGGAAGAGAAGGAASTGDPGAEGTSSVFAVSGGTAQPRPYYVPLLQQVLGSPPSPGPTPPLLSPPPVQSQSLLQPSSPLPGPSPYSGPTRGLTEHCEPESRPVSPVSRAALPVRTARAGRVSCQRPPPVPCTHSMTLRPSTAPQRVHLPSPPASSLPAGPDPTSDSLRAASPAVTRFLATAVTDPLFESTAVSALVGAACHLDFAASLDAESASASVSPPSVGDPDAPDIPTPRSYAEAIEGPYSSQWQAAMDAEMASWKSTGTYVDEVPPPGANIVRGMWIFRVKRPPGSPPAFKARYVARGFSQRQGRDYELHSLDFSTAFLQGSLHEEMWLRRPPGFTGSFPAGTKWSLRRPVYGLRQAPREWHDTLRTTLATLGFAPSTADPSLFLRTHTTLPPFYVLVDVDNLVFATADTEALAHVKSELKKRHTCTDLGELTSYLGLRITRDRAQRTTTLTQSHMVKQVLQRFGFTYSSPQSTPLPSGHSLLAPPSDESIEPSGPYLELVGYLMYLMTCTRPDLAYLLSLLARYVAPGRHRKSGLGFKSQCVHFGHPNTGGCQRSTSDPRLILGKGYRLVVLGGRARVVLTGHADASCVDDLATQRSSQGYTFSLGSGSVSWRSTRSSSVLSSNCLAEIYAGAMAAQELRWLTYLLTDLGEAPRSAPVLYVDNKAMLELCQEHRLEHRTKHIALRYFLARDLQQRGQLRLPYVASQANTADVFTKALQPFDHQRFCTVLGLVPTVPHLLTS
ncbi:unnamed protein product [Closterium sp. NIES-54]